jgi:AraC-like DNA-binding protein
MIDQHETHHPPSSPLARHRHGPAYLALVECGTYLEYSVDGVYRCSTGMAVFHPCFHSHGNQFADHRVTVTNITIDVKVEYQVLALDERHFAWARQSVDRSEMVSIVLNEGHLMSAEPSPSLVRTMAQSLQSDPGQRIDELADALRVSPEHASRQFRRFNGMSPTAFRTEQRFRRAMADLEAGYSAIEIAHRWGYSDQSHLCRAVKAATSRTISCLQRSDLFKTQRLSA